ncbi:uncharacterized protein LOC132546118 [Ylistrum balloti]|uniref:uncharacterized protein LOC132546118 n=1 Tax=Ylistrum balloti TaxID=509963 RepID=UPI002905D98E|nr:uncharacterized protein LOC132546118 [Ylistrum balloti]
MGFVYIRLLVFLVLLLVVRGQEDEAENGEDPRNRAAHTTGGYSGTTSRDRLGVIMSPGYPGNYPDNYRFRYDIYLGREKSDLEINFKIFDLEYCSNCDCDYIEIENYKLAKPLKYCGAALPNGNGQVYLDNLDDYVWITFQSNSNQRRPGFYATYEVTQRSGNDSFLAGGSVCPPIACPYCEVGQTPEYDYTSVCPYCYCRRYQENTSPMTSLCPPVFCPACPYGFKQHMDYSSYKCTHCYCVHDHQSTSNQETTTSYYPWYHHTTTRRPWQTTSHRPWRTTSYRPWHPESTSYRPWQTTSYRPWHPESTSYRPWQTTSYRPWRQESTSYRPWHTTSYRPWHPESTSYRPWHTTSHHPWRPASTTGYYPWRPHYSWETTTATYDRSCGRGYFFASSGIIRTPGAPNHLYPSGTDCEYNIDVGGVIGTRKTVALRFDFFELEKCGGCSCDSLTINSEETSGVRMCDNYLVNTSRTYYVHTTSDILKLRFTTDSTVVRSGFSLSYDVLSSDVNDTCDNDTCYTCNGPPNFDYFGCCFCSNGQHEYTTSGYNYSTPNVYSKSRLLQILTNIEHHAQILEQYARDVENEANDAKNMVAQSFG